MIRGTTIVLAVGLVILFLVGLGQHATGWLTWLDGLAAVCGFLIAGSLGDEATRAARGGTIVSLAIGLGVLWIIALATHRETWLTWWTFGFAVAYLLLGIVGSTRTIETRMGTGARTPHAV